MGSLSVHFKLLACDLLSLVNHRTTPPTFSRNSTPVSCVETLGVVVSRQRREQFLKFLVDDGSGCVPCVLWLNHYSLGRKRWREPSDLDIKAGMALEQAEMVRLGEVVRVRGRVGVYREEMQVTVRDVVVERDPNAEVLFWLECIRLARECYDLGPL
ncbi:CST complex subunit STN1 [Typha latifolia]|uniref:CST complex subunit STN1 n=1 Tax=Typha latifolia TaxID=4733 RepID=UPI003C2BEA04